MDVVTFGPVDIWIRFVTLGIVGFLLTRWRPWLLALVVVVAGWLAWSRLRLLPPDDVRAFILDPALHRALRTVELHIYAAAIVSVLLGALGMWARRSRPTV